MTLKKNIDFVKVVGVTEIWIHLMSPGPRYSKLHKKTTVIKSSQFALIWLNILMKWIIFWFDLNNPNYATNWWKWIHIEMFYLNSTLNFGIPPVLVFQLEVCLPYSRLLAGIQILAVFPNLRWNSNITSLCDLCTGWCFRGD